MDTEAQAPQLERRAETRGETRQDPPNVPGKWSNAAKSRHLRVREVALKASGLGQEDGSWRDRVAISTQRVGDRLRSIRRQKGLSLHEVEAMSNEEFKASVLGAYERGERVISVPRLMRAAFTPDRTIAQAWRDVPAGKSGWPALRKLVPRDRRSTIITRHGRPVAALVPIEAYGAATRQQPLMPAAGSGRGLWGKNSTRALRKLRDEWSR